MTNMTIPVLYKRLTEGKISKKEFMYYIRRSEKLPFITNVTSYDDAIKILKNKAIIQESASVKPFYLVDDTGEVIDSTMAVDQEAAKAYFAKEYEGVLKSMAVIGAIGQEVANDTEEDYVDDYVPGDYDGGGDDFNDGEFWEGVDKDQLKIGIDTELEHTKNREVAKKIAMDHLGEDPKYYSKLTQAGLEEGVSPFRLKKGQVYIYTGGAEYEPVTYIGRAEENQALRPGSSMGKGYLFKWNNSSRWDKDEKPRYLELGPHSVTKYIFNEEDDYIFENKILDVDRVNPYELQKGIEYEMKYTDKPAPDWNGNLSSLSSEVEKAKKKALKCISKDPLYYTKLEAGIKKEAKTVKVSSDGMAKITKVKKDVANTQTSLGNKEKSKSKNAGVKEMKGSKKVPKGVKMMKEGYSSRYPDSPKDRLHFWKEKPAEGEYEVERDERGKIVSATNKNGDTFKVGDEAFTSDKKPQKITIRSFIESQHRIKAVYRIVDLKGKETLTLETYDIDGLKKADDITERIKDYVVKKLKTELDQDIIAKAKQGKLVMNLPKGSREEKEAMRNKIPYSSY